MFNSELRPYCVLTGISSNLTDAPANQQIHNILAHNSTHAITTALELAGPGSILVRCSLEGDW